MAEDIKVQPEEIIAEQPMPRCWDKIKLHKLKILGGVLGVLIFAGAVFGAYKIGQEQTQIGPQPTPSPTVTCGPCPQFMPPHPDFCKDGTLIPGGEDECGCQLPPKCQSPTANWKTYVATDVGFSIKYPLDWYLEENSDFQKPTAVKDALEVKVQFASFKPPFKGPAGATRSGCHFDILAAETKMTLDQFIDKNPTIGSLKGLPDREEKIEVAGKTAERRVYLPKKNVLETRTTVYVANNDGKIVVFYYFSELAEQIADCENTFDLMLSTFKFLPSEVPEEEKCQKDSDCGVDICDCKALNKNFIKPEHKICLRVCNGIPTCHENRCVLRVFCKETRPEICTMECIQNPPYICGSNGKSYCNVCETCADPEVEWYIIQDGPCRT